VSQLWGAVQDSGNRTRPRFSWPSPGTLDDADDALGRFEIVRLYATFRPLESIILLMRRVSRAAWNRNIHYYPIVLGAVPRDCRRALDVGCGEGRLASELAERCGEVVGIDVHAPRLARARAACVRSNLSFVEGDVTLI
jgi:2-polyprenyl-3-methyl-5-hydroxy-6-metoxy-1,4-benzoquinol methylase